MKKLVPLFLVVTLTIAIPAVAFMALVPEVIPQWEHTVAESGSDARELAAALSPTSHLKSPFWYFLYPWQTLATGIFAVIAALIGAAALSWQIGEQHRLEKEAQKQRMRQVAKALAGEVFTLIQIVRRRQMREHFQCALDHAEQGKIWVPKFPIRSNYFRVFEGLGSDIGLLPGELPYQVAGFYTLANGLQDTLKGIAEDFYSITDVHQVRHGAISVLDDLNDLEAIGLHLVEELERVAE
ncbi:MAG TPA: hypothetical protein VD978_16490 [Azospirillum sp.]|nr:hypothetical protein [Azospirillum sp.]